MFWPDVYRRISYIGNFSYLPPWKTAILLLVFGCFVLFGWGLGWKTSATNSKQDILEIKECNHDGCVCVVCVVCGGCWAQVAMDDVERRKLIEVDTLHVNDIRLLLFQCWKSFATVIDTGGHEGKIPPGKTSRQTWTSPIICLNMSESSNLPRLW